MRRAGAPGGTTSRLCRVIGLGGRLLRAVWRRGRAVVLKRARRPRVPTSRRMLRLEH
jgi:hypothetical protein